ncbi:serine hydrolase [Clostridium grantii]|uniref:Beta-lactamase class A n=1 Tax=Clostridium grantii DSM 8605 TaxID=1121316 RepID=A0A1M5UDF2_9CLOT|nr:serine hydrolase [Clostridium grantii]SHH61082.1 beta-lactamase class A [Clostridium grantii DSM 8605]
MRKKILKIINEYGINTAIYYKNLENNKKFTLNEKEKLPSASLIKLFIMYHAFKKVSEESLSLEIQIPVNRNDTVEYSIIEALSIDKYSLEDLITLMIIQSDNTATNILINYLGMSNINDTINELSMQKTSLNRKMMDFYARENGIDNWTSAEDVGELLYKIYKDEFRNSELNKKIFAIMKRQIFMTMIPRYLNESYEIFNKTGDLPNINNDAAIIFHSQGNSILVILTKDCKDKYKAQEFVGKVAKIILEENI